MRIFVLFISFMLINVLVGVDVVTPARGQQLIRMGDGTCLLASGWDGSNTLSEVYRFDGAVWQVAEPMAIPRTGYSATLLRTGKVLIVGGLINTANAETATAVLFDPVSGHWSSAGSRSVATHVHSATLLADGTVLIVGGSINPNQDPTGNVDRYDPIANTWSPCAPMLTPRSEQVDVLLADGRVLFTGGYVSPNVRLATADIYDPVADAWTAVPSMAQVRQAHTASILPDNRVIVVGGGDGGTAFSSTEIFYPLTSTWSAGPSMSFARVGHTMVRLDDGKLLVMGNATIQCELYDPLTSSWSQPTQAVLSGPRGLHASTLLDDGRVISVAGYDGFNHLGTAEAIGQSITFPVIGNRTETDVPFAISATSSAALPITFSIVSGPATVSGSMVTLTGTGTVVVKASQTGDSDWFPAARTQSFSSLPESGSESTKCAAGSLFSLIIMLGIMGVKSGIPRRVGMVKD